MGPSDGGGGGPPGGSGSAAGPGPAWPGIDDLVLVERVRLLNSRAGIAVLVTLLNAVLVSRVYSRIASPAACAVWLGFIFATMALRMVATRAYARRGGEAAAARRWARLHALGAGCNGAAWGAFAALYLGRASPLHQVFLVLAT